jgi:3-dehydroquinate synthase
MKSRVLEVPLLDRSYAIHVDDGGLDASAKRIAAFLREPSAFVVTNATVKKRHGARVEKAFEGNFKARWIVIPDGERHKTLSTVEKVLTSLSKLGANRKSLVIAFGGGVVGDIAGFAAAVYMRGIDFIQMPTTLLAQVDSSVGGKTGVDLTTGKNLAGSFHQPRAVFIHTDFLRTLPEREYLCGLAEVIKYGVIADSDFFQTLDLRRGKILKRDAGSVADAVMRSLATKAEIVSRDEREEGERAFLNYGHTLGHAAEALTGFSRVRHGEAVAMGMAFAARLSRRLGLLKDGDRDAIVELIASYGLPTRWPKLNPSRYLFAMRRDKKASSGNIRFILPVKIGKVEAVTVAPEDIKACLSANI